LRAVCIISTTQVAWAAAPEEGVSTLVTLLLFVIGTAFLIKGADLLVDGASSVARTLGVSDLVIGLTIVAFGTSLPELVVSVVAGIRGNTGIAIGNVVGSNTANILLILGVASAIRPIRTSEATARKEIPFCLLAAVLVAILPNDQWIDGAAKNEIARIDGIILLLFFIIFLYYVFEVIRVGLPASETQEQSAPPVSRSAFYIVIGLAGLVIGGRWVVNGAVAAARTFGVGEDVIGLTLVAVGTSLPELATSAVAAYRKNSDIAVGNIVGSNIFNVFFVLAITGVIAPLPFAPHNNVDIGVMFAATLALFLLVTYGRLKYVIQRAEGVFFLTLYVAYMIFLYVRG
jgi:cation:H+ antiporter